MSGFLLDIYPASTVIKALFHTFNAAGASVTVTGLAAADVTIYKDGSTTQRSSAAGISVATDFDAITGVHQASIDLGDNTDAGFYAVGSQYSVVISSFTADSQTVSFVLGAFRIMATEHTTGFPVITVKDGTGTGEIDTTSGGVLVAAIANNAITAASINADAITDAKVAADVTIASVTGSVGSVSGAVGSVTGNVGGNVVGSVASVTNAVTLTGAYDFAKGTTAMTEAYAANGVAPTPVQALFSIQQMLQMFAIAGTNLTVKKLDNSTTAFIVTLNDAVNPTGAART